MVNLKLLEEEEDAEKKNLKERETKRVKSKSEPIDTSGPTSFDELFEEMEAS